MGQPRYAYDSTKSSLILSYNMLKIMESVAMETQLQHQRVQLTFTIVKIQLWIHVGMVLVLLVIKHSFVILFWTWTLHMFFLQNVHKSVDAITKTGCIGCVWCQNIPVVNRKNGCLVSLICGQWNQSFRLKPMNWLFTL